MTPEQSEFLTALKRKGRFERMRSQKSRLEKQRAKRTDAQKAKVREHRERRARLIAARDKKQRVLATGYKKRRVIRPAEMIVGLQKAVGDLTSQDPSLVSRASAAWPKLQASALVTLKYASVAEGVTIRQLLDQGSKIVARLTVAPQDVKTVAVKPPVVDPSVVDPLVITQANGDEQEGIWARLWPEDKPFYKKPGIWGLVVIAGAYLWAKKRN